MLWILLYLLLTASFISPKCELLYLPLMLVFISPKCELLYLPLMAGFFFISPKCELLYLPLMAGFLITKICITVSTFNGSLLYHQDMYYCI